MPTFKVTHPQTGKTISITGDTSPTEQELDGIFSQTDNKSLPGIFSDNPLSRAKNDMQNGSSMGKAFAENVPLVGNLMRVGQDVGAGIGAMIAQGPTQKMGDMASEIEKQAAAETDPAKKRSLLSQSINMRTQQGNQAAETAKGFTKDVNDNPILRGFKGAAELTTAAELPELAIKSVTALPKIVGKAVDVAKDVGSYGGRAFEMAKNVVTHPSKTSAANWATDIAEEGSKAGKKVDWATISSDIKDTLFGNKERGIPGSVLRTKELDKSFQKFIEQQTPEMITETGKNGLPQIATRQMDPTDVLNLRRQIVGTYGDKNLFSQILEQITGKGKTPADQLVAKHARNVISDTLKSMVPDIEQPDKLYSFYKKMGGDVPAWMKRAVVGLLAKQAVGAVTGNLSPKVVDAVTGL